MSWFFLIGSTQKFVFRPWQDSNLQSPDSKSDALSIWPQGPNYSFLWYHRYWSRFIMQFENDVSLIGLTSITWPVSVDLIRLNKKYKGQ